MQVHRTCFIVGKISKKNMQVHRTCFMVNIMANTNIMKTFIS